MPTHNALAYRKAVPAWRDTYLIHVPIDDESHLLFVSQQVRIKPEDLPAYRKHYDGYLEERKRMSVKGCGERIVAGEIFLADALDHPNLVTLEDYIAQIGQGRIVDRSKDHLSRMDKGVMLLRQIRQRELGALADHGKPKEWVPMKERPDTEIVERVLRHEGTGARQPVSV